MIMEREEVRDRVTTASLTTEDDKEREKVGDGYVVVSLPHTRSGSKGKVIGVSVHINIIGERAKRARHSQVCSIENHILEKWLPLKSERGSFPIFFHPA